MFHMSKSKECTGMLLSVMGQNFAQFEPAISRACTVWYVALSASLERSKNLASAASNVQPTIQAALSIVGGGGEGDL